MRRILPLLAGLTAGCAAAEYDLVIRGGTIYDGSGGAPFTADVAVRGDRIAAVGGTLRGKTEIDARGLAVAPGFTYHRAMKRYSLGERG